MRTIRDIRVRAALLPRPVSHAVALQEGQISVQSEVSPRTGGPICTLFEGVPNSRYHPFSLPDSISLGLTSFFFFGSEDAASTQRSVNLCL